MQIENRTIRVLVAKPGLDGHDRGALVVAQGLRDAGMEVIYTGLRQTPEQIAAIAVQEDVDCVGLSSLSGAHMQLFPEVVRKLQERGADDILVIGGGVIPDEDITELQKNGIRCVFTPGTPISSIADFVRENIQKKTYTTIPTPVHDDSIDSGLSETVTSFSHLHPERVDHIGIAVHKTAEVLPFYRDQLGMQIIHEETVNDQLVHVTFLQLPNLVLELLEPTSSDSPVASFLEKRGPGMHHIAYKVSNIEEALEEASTAGYRLIDRVPRKGAHGKWIAFLHPKQTGGVLTELCQNIQQEDDNGK